MNNIETCICQREMSLLGSTSFGFAQNTIHGFLTLSRTSPGFYMSASFLKTLWEKEKLLVSSIFYFFHSVFYPFGDLFSNFHHI